MTYDGVGNVLTRMRVGGGTASVTYGYNRNSDQLSTATPSGSSALSYSYDADGNLLKRALGKTTQLAIAYNADGRPMSAAGPRQRISSLRFSSNSFLSISPRAKRSSRMSSAVPPRP